MQTSSLFVLGLIVGALTVFAIRAASITGDNAAASGQPDQPANEHPEDPHAGHGDVPSPAPAPAPAPAPTPAPAPAPAPAAHDHGEDADHAGHGSKEPENLICPVMGNEVDPDVYVDHKGRRIGFCCPPCIAKFNANPAKYLKKVDAEIAARTGDK